MAQKTDDTKNRRNRVRSQHDDNPFSIPRRSAWYLLRTTLIIALVVVLAFVAFLYAMDAANIYIIVTEGLTLRINCTLGDGDPNELYEYFLSDFVDSDERIHNNPYELYAIDSFDYRLDLNGFSLLPFASTATMTVTERIPYITGEGTPNAPSGAIPEWEAGRYLVSCVNIDGRWYISDVSLVEANPPEEVRPTPDMSLLSPTPSSSPSPTQTQPSPSETITGQPPETAPDPTN